MRVEATGLTHPGSTRPGNEDAMVVGPWVCAGFRTVPATISMRVEEPVVCAVADGLGGHACGEIASEHVVRGLAAAGPGLRDEAAVGRALHRLHEELFERMDRDSHLAGMGTTVAGLVVLPGRVVTFNVGDARTYQVEGGYLGQMSADDRPPRSDPAGRRSVVTRSLGGTVEPSGLEPHLGSHTLAAGSRFLLCTDGLTDVLALDDIERALKEPGGEAAVGRLIAMTLQAGAPDNVSVLLVDVIPEPPR